MGEELNGGQPAGAGVWLYAHMATYLRGLGRLETGQVAVKTHTSRAEGRGGKDGHRP